MPVPQGKVSTLFETTFAPLPGRPHPQAAVAEFVAGSGGAAGPDGRMRDFHRRLGECREGDLPSSCEVTDRPPDQVQPNSIYIPNTSFWAQRAGSSLPTFSGLMTWPT